MASISERESREIEEANASSATPVVFIHGLWLLPNSWANWADFFKQAGYAPVSLCPGEAFAVEVDVADEEGVAGMYAQTSERFGGVDVLYNNAGISPGDDASVLETSVEAWQRVQDCMPVIVRTPAG